MGLLLKMKYKRLTSGFIDVIGNSLKSFVEQYYLFQFEMKSLALELSAVCQVLFVKDSRMQNHHLQLIILTESFDFLTICSCRK